MKYLYTIPYEDKFIIYQPLKRLAFLGNSALVNLILELGNGSARSEIQEHASAVAFLDQIGFFEPNPSAPPEPPMDAPFKPTIAVLFLTTACNFRCIYCYASGGENKTQNMPVELGIQAIDQVCRHAVALGADRFTLGFHGGGEPSLAKQQLRKLVRYARTREIPCQINLTTNGFWSEPETDWILGNIDEISLSFDGLQRIQDRQRPLASGKGTYHVVMDNIQKMEQRSVPYGIRITVTDESIDSLPRNMAFLCRETACRAFQVEPAFNHGRADTNNIALKQNMRFANAFLEAYDIAAAAGRHIYYSGARPWLMTTRFCQAPEKALIVGPDGFLTACYEVCSKTHELAHNFIHGTLLEDGRITSQNNRRKRLHEKIQERRSACEDCFCFWHCAGDCPSKTFTSITNGHLRFGERCDLNRLITMELLVRYIRDGNGIWQGDEQRLDTDCESKFDGMNLQTKFS
jgi:uncharacterized protein